MALSERQAELIETHREIQREGLPYVLIGGWAVSAFQTRTTMDVDMVIPESALGDFERVLEERGYAKERDVEVSEVYDGQFVEFEKQVGDYSVSFDAPVGSVGCRQTDAEWSYEYLEDHSTVESLEVAPDLEARIPKPALLFGLKLQSGRLADARDLVVVGNHANWKDIKRHLLRGDIEKLKANITGVIGELESEHFRDSFHGVFQQNELDETDVDELSAFLRSLEDEL